MVKNIFYRFLKHFLGVDEIVLNRPFLIEHGLKLVLNPESGILKFLFSGRDGIKFFGTLGTGRDSRPIFGTGRDSGRDFE